MRYIVFLILISGTLSAQTGIKDFQIVSDTPYDSLQVLVNDTNNLSSTYKYGSWMQKSSFQATFGDRDWYKLGAVTIPNNIDTAYRTGPTLLGHDKKIWLGDGVLQISDTAHNHTALIDLYSNHDYTYAMRFFSDDISYGPVTYFNAWGALYTSAWITISAAHTGSGSGFAITPPSSESFMLGINSDVGGPAVQVRTSTAVGSHLFSGLDSDGDHRIKIESDGKIRWGIDTLTNMDTDLFRADSAKLKTTGTIGFEWNVGNPDGIAAMSGAYLTGASVGDGLYFDADTIKVDFTSTNDHDWYKAGGLKPDDNTQDIYHEGDVHIGQTSMLGTADLNVVGLTSLVQSATVNNLFINGGNLTATGIDNVALQSGAGSALTSGAGNVLIGKNAGDAINSGLRNVVIGAEAGGSITTGGNNFALGFGSLGSVTTTSNNVAIGASSLSAATSEYNIGIGTSAGQSNTGQDNIFIGGDAGSSATGNTNTIVGRYAGYSMAGGGVALGYGAGYNENTANKLYIHNAGGTSLANGKAISIIYGEMDATTANQLLHFNSKVLPRYMGSTSTSIGGYDASGYLSTVGTGWGIDLTSGNLVVDSSQVATQYDLTTIADTDDQNLTVEGAGPTYDIAIDNGTDVTIAGAGIVTLSETPANTLVITGTEVDGSITNEIQTLDVSGTTQPITFDLSSDASDITITGAGISAITASGNAITVTSTEVDGSITNEIQDITLTGTNPYVLDLADDATDVTFAGAGIVTLSEGVANTLTITGTEVDGSTSNELNTIEEGNVSVQTGNITTDYQTMFDVATDGATEVNVSLDLSEATTVTTAESDDYLIMHDAGLAAHQKMLWSDFVIDIIGFEEDNINEGSGNTFDFGTGIDLAVTGPEADVTLDFNEFTTDAATEGDEYVILYDPSAVAQEKVLITSFGADGNGIYSGDGTTPTDVDVTMTDNIDFGAGLLYLDDVTGEVGIGTQTPDVQLDVEGNSANVLIHDLNGGTGNQLMLRTNISATGTGVFGGVSFQHHDAANIDVWDIEGNRRVNDEVNSTLEIRANEATDAQVFLAEKNANLSDNTTESHIAFNGGIANTQNYDWAGGADLELDRSYHIVNATGGAATDTLKLPEIASTSDNWDATITATQVQVGQTFDITNFRSGVNLIVVAYNPTTGNSDLIDSQTNTTTFSVKSMPQNTSLIFKAKRLASGVGYWYTN